MIRPSIPRHLDAQFNPDCGKTLIMRELSFKQKEEMRSQSAETQRNRLARRETGKSTVRAAIIGRHTLRRPLPTLLVSTGKNVNRNSRRSWAGVTANGAESKVCLLWVSEVPAISPAEINKAL